ncbi:hypothetical protein C2845_PM13G11080 [Panicum miliaceum]|uniref:Uncharacterized protein n=1 Tax=Panicum miliaceum TaxID=4540 RepID=A0A3L6RKT3_PANMI|nr:hypothetical protein C2845_PM13G11080 [Panicum miliaceum]
MKKETFICCREPIYPAPDDSKAGREGGVCARASDGRRDPEDSGTSRVLCSWSGRYYGCDDGRRGGGSAVMGISPNSDDAPVAHGGWSSPVGTGRGRRRRHSAPFVVSSPDPLHVARAGGDGGRFWALQDEGSSDGEDAEGKTPPEAAGESDSEFLHDCLMAGYSVDEIRRAEALASVVSPGFGSVDCGA